MSCDVDIYMSSACHVMFRFFTQMTYICMSCDVDIYMSFVCHVMCRCMSYTLIYTYLYTLIYTHLSSDGIYVCHVMFRFFRQMTYICMCMSCDVDIYMSSVCHVMVRCMSYTLIYTHLSYFFYTYHLYFFFTYGTKRVCHTHALVIPCIFFFLPKSVCHIHTLVISCMFFIDVYVFNVL